MLLSWATPSIQLILYCFVFFEWKTYLGVSVENGEDVLRTGRAAEPFDDKLETSVLDGYNI